MKIRKPDYYDRFQCIAGACSDSCCIGWEIDVDEDKRKFYGSLDGEFGRRLRNCIDWEEGHFILQGKEERCPFLNEENLCDLILNLGEDALCDICREHPRFYDWFDDLTEAGVGLCCEAAARLILESETPARFIEQEVYAEEGEKEAGNELTEVLFHARSTAFLLLQSRGLSVWRRLFLVTAYIEELQDALDFGNFDEIEESSKYYAGIAEDTYDGRGWETIQMRVSYTQILNLCRELEPIDESWPETLDSLNKLISDPGLFLKLENEMLAQTAGREYEYEHLAVYFIYRYFMKCRMDGDIQSKGFLAVFCVLLIRLLDIETYRKKGRVTKEDRVQNAKNCSKEIEYSEDNLAYLEKTFWKCDTFLDLQSR